MSLKQEDMVPKFTENDPINYYDFIIDINSFRHLKKSKEITDWGWDVLINKNFNYKEATKKDYISIGVVGNGNRGKSFLLSKISNFNFPTGYSVKTKGISIKYPSPEGNKNFVLFDSAGFETPLVETEDFKLGDITDATKAEKIINEIARDRAILEYFTQKFVLTYSNVIIVVVGQLTFSEQQLLIKIKNENKKKRIFVVHNLFNFETKRQVEDYINDILLKSITFKLERQNYVNLSTDNEEAGQNNEEAAQKENNCYYHEELGKESVEHLILGKEGSESGNYYNRKTLLYLKNTITAETKVKKVPIIQNVIKHLSGISNIIFEYPIPKENIKYEGGKIFVDNFDKQIILRSLATDSLGASSFYGQAFQPNFTFYVVNDYKELPELESIKLESDNDEIKGLSDLEGKTIYVLQVELPGNAEYKNDPAFETSSEGKILLSFKGQRNLYKDESTDEDKKRDSYRNEIKLGKFHLFFEASNDIISIEKTKIGNKYEDGVCTFYFYGGSPNDNTEELEF